MATLSDVHLTDQSLIFVSTNLVASELAEEIVILSLKTGLYYGLSEVGCYVWKLIQTPITFSELRQVLLDRYDVGIEQCDRDLKALLKDLSHAELLEIR